MHLNHIWQRTFHFKIVIAIFLDLEPLWPYSVTKPNFSYLGCSSRHVISKTKSVAPHFFYISDITISSSFNGKILRKKSMLENFRANVLYRGISSLEQYKTHRLWNNYLMRIDHKPVFFFREWLAKGILRVESLIKDRTCFLSYKEFLNKYHCKSCPLAFSGIIATLKTIRMRFKENIDSLETVEVESFIKALQKTKKPSNLTYRNLVTTKSEK